ncbi:DUF4279 domain-containing protein [Amycolatopsis roodepoortensis]|uniref:DUF4279 domain-containing protein n=1 Tax=Amycolatopsis roodepoortensis TaxID=700274 RepID=UPI00214CF786|nr:DUF4279 domain-containing protein [Amycolatopsis roodepoortensis]UUV28309.1 DUF4279 domain-containing protein [Amycolatopsis roodepoortensis]
MGEIDYRTQGSWAKVSLRVPLGALSLEQVERIVGRPTDLDGRGRPSDHWWIVDFYGKEGESLERQLDLLAEMICTYREGLIEVGRQADGINVFIGWEPRRGQDSVGFDANLISSLAEIGGRIILDIMTDDCDHDCESIS